MTAKKNYGFFFCLVFFLALHVVFFLTRHHYIHWDEAVYISIGKYFFSLGTEGLFESIRPPGLPLLLGFFWRIGFDSIFVYQIILILFSAGVLFLVYLLGKEIFSDTSALFAVVALVLTPLFFQSSISIMTEIPAAFFLLLSLFLFVKKRSHLLVGFTAGIAFLFKFPAGLFVASLLLLIFFQQKTLFKKMTDFCFLSLGFFITTLPFFFFNYFQYRADTATLFDALFRPFLLGAAHAANPFHAISGSWQNFFFYFSEIIKNNPLLLLGFAGCIFFLFSKNEKHRVLFVPLFILFIYFTSIVNKQLRFAVLFAPLLALYTGDILYRIQHYTCKKSTVKKAIFWFALFYPLFTLFFFPTLKLIYRFYPEEPLAIEEEYYSYFSTINKSIILTTEPYFTAYSDGILSYPYYNNLTDAREIYEKYKDTADYIIFTTGFYPCTDASCLEQVEALHHEIAKTHTLIYQKEWHGEMKEIFATT